jgi:hypothetical protein
MPGQDKTGPLGQGPLTGRGLGLCGGGFRRGFGRGFGRMAFAPVELSTEQEKKVLEAELAELEAEKTEIQKRLKEMK